ncbi:NAD-dependent epimerase/dehydratase family protein [Agreia pratensis]|nr:NAD-dependent epimerase/dehydratase family protein [Agreia pratensis]MBF4633766.1 NAD-dependent epimerase/dehydratase family protein [Agreia pratensis]
MSIFLTGATGYIGSAVLRQLRLQGRDVTALVRSPEKAAKIEALGATAVIGDITDTELVTEQAIASDGVIHLAAPGDDSSRDADDAFVTAVFAGLEGSDKRYVHTGGIWVWGSNSDITEDSPRNAPAIVAWREEIEKRVLGAQGVSTTLIAPAVVFGHGAGIAALFTGDHDGDATPAVKLIGDGSQHWTTVHVDDLAELYILAFDLGESGSTYIGASGENPTVHEIGEAAAFGQGLDSRVEAQTVEETYARLGEPFADALLLDQQARGSAARIDLGWEPNGPSILDELRTGSYAVKN